MTDPLDDLRRAWRADAPLPLGFESSELEHCDASTRASVEWLRAAHAARSRSAAPAGVPPAVQLAHARARRQATRRLVARPVAVVAALAAAAAALLLARAFVDRERPVEVPVHVAVGEAPDAPVAQGPPVAQDAPEAQGPPVEPVAATTGAEPETTAASRTTAVPPGRFRSRDDGIELVSGSVRLVLLTPNTSNPSRGEPR